jgi:general secretion pathway protein D
MRSILFSLTWALAALAPVLAADGPPASSGPASSVAAANQMTMPLESLLKQVGSLSRKGFIVSSKAPANVVVGTIDPKSVTLPILMSILWNNDLTAFEVNGVVNIAPQADVRTYPMPTVTGTEKTISDDEWVTQLIRTRYIDAPDLVPLLRPLVPREGHLAAFRDKRTLVLTDRFGNVKRLAAIVRAVDTPSAAAAAPSQAAPPQ